MTTKTRLYKVTTPTKVRLIESPNVQRAIAFAAADEISAYIPHQTEVFDLAKSGLEIERVIDGPITDETRAAVGQSHMMGAAA